MSKIKFGCPHITATDENACAIWNQHTTVSHPSINFEFRFQKWNTATTTQIDNIHDKSPICCVDEDLCFENSFVWHGKPYQVSVLNIGSKFTIQSIRALISTHKSHTIPSTVCSGTQTTYADDVSCVGVTHFPKRPDVIHFGRAKYIFSCHPHMLKIKNDNRASHYYTKTDQLAPTNTPTMRHIW